MDELLCHLFQWKRIVFLFCIIYYSSTVLSKECLQNDQCSCTFDDDSGDMDLHNLGLQTGDPL